MKKGSILLLGIAGVYLWFKFIKGWYMHTKVPNIQEFNKLDTKRQQIETKIETKQATLQDVREWKDLTNTLQYACYGITSRTDLEGICLLISTLYPLKADQQLLYNFLMEIAAVESNLGTFIYKIDRGYGYGIFQFDRIAFDDVKQLIQRHQRNNFLFICNRDIDSIKYEDLREQALICAFFCRTYLYYRIPSSIPQDRESRAKQWKKYYNTELGAGTIAKYMSKSQEYMV